MADELLPLIDRYWELAYAEGKEGRDHDTEAGDAQATRQAIEQAIRTRDAEIARLRAEVERLRARCEALVGKWRREAEAGRAHMRSRLEMSETAGAVISAMTQQLDQVAAELLAALREEG